MDRTVPNSGNEEIQLYLRTYYSLLRSSRPVRVKTLIEAHKRMNSALHIAADAPTLDTSALTYALLRMPACLPDISDVVMGQSERVFAQNGYPNIEQWQVVTAPARRRRIFYNGAGTLAIYIASRSDIDDIVPILTAYQIERDKLHRILQRPTLIQLLEQSIDETDLIAELVAQTAVSLEDWQRLSHVFQPSLQAGLLKIATKEQAISVRSLAGSLADYKRATTRWWRNVEQKTPDINFDQRPVYFISSNTHSLANALSGFALEREVELQAYIDATGSEALQKEYHDIMERNVPSSRENFLYYVMKKHEQDAIGDSVKADRIASEEAVGIRRIPSSHSFDVETQVIELNKLDIDKLDKRLCFDGIQAIRDSNALIINIDYPLGMAAYQLLSEIARNVDDVRGLYLIGKAATLNGQIGDVMMPNVVHDEHSDNTYLFNNAISDEDVAPYLVYGAVLDNQKAITVPGTFLQNEGYMALFYREGYTDMEMEAGPYLSAIYEMTRPKRHPYNEIVDLHKAPFPIGILHYASDTPFSKGKNLGAQSLSYFGMDPTYATTIATMLAILRTELGNK